MLAVALAVTGLGLALQRAISSEPRELRLSLGKAARSSGAHCIKGPTGDRAGFRGPARWLALRTLCRSAFRRRRFARPSRRRRFALRTSARSGPAALSGPGSRAAPAGPRSAAPRGTRAGPVADLALAERGVAVAVRAERGLRVVDVQRRGARGRSSRRARRRLRQRAVGASRCRSPTPACGRSRGRGRCAVAAPPSSISSRQLVEVAAERAAGAGGVLEQERAALRLGQRLA